MAIAPLASLLGGHSLQSASHLTDTAVNKPHCQERGASSMPGTRIPIYELHVGMYVAKLDLSWLRSPFLRHSFLIEHPSQIEKLIHAGVKVVEIDPARGHYFADSPGLVPRTDSPSASETTSAVHQRKSLTRLNEE